MSGLYIHIPFCRSKCAYCDFYSSPKAEYMPAYVDALLQELEMRRDEIESQRLTTIYIGGGTPSSLPLGLLSKLFEGIHRLIDTSAVVETTIEVNPEDVTADFLNHTLSLGADRLSMGVQSLNDSELRAVGRRHSAGVALKAVEMIAARFENYNVDVIFGLPGQTLESLTATVDRLLAFRPPHISAYLLSYEPGTRLYAALSVGKVKEVSEDEAEIMYREVAGRLADAGYDHYEISNYALPGRYSRHNSSYWNLTPYLGLGAAAHSFDGHLRRYNPSSINTYIETINNHKCCYIIDEETDWQRFNDLLLVTFRTSAGFPLSALDRWPAEIAGNFRSQAGQLLSTGKLICRDGVLTIPPENWLTSDAVLRQLIITD